MSLALSTGLEGRILELDVSGQLRKDDYERFVPLVEEAIDEHGRIGLLVVMRDFHGWKAGGLWKDLVFDLKHLRDFERIALVGEARWQAVMAAIWRPFTTAKVRYFELDRLDEARDWVRRRS